jgi:hypothetical protein
MDGCQTVPFGKHSQAFQDLFWVMVQSIKYCPFILNKNGSTDFAFQALSAFACPAVSNDVPVIHFAITRTVPIPAKRTCKG